MSLLKDPWQPRLIPLEGFVERHHFAPWFMAIIALVVALVCFQFVIAPIAIVALLLNRGVAAEDLLNEVLQVMQNDAGLLLSANTAGQIFGLALPVFIFTRLSTRRTGAFLRIRGTSVPVLLLSLVGLAALIPIVDLAGTLNDALPWPDSIRQFEQLMMEPVQEYLSKKSNLIPGLLMIALTPAICEELLFRGYVQRQAERSMGIIWGIVFTGVIFGAYHMQLTKVFPLSILGLYLAYLTWRTGSILPAILVHFANNAFAVILSIFFLKKDGEALPDVEQLNLPLYFVVAGFVVFACAVYLVESISRAKLQTIAVQSEIPDIEDVSYE